LSQSMRFLIAWSDLRGADVIAANPTKDIIRRTQNVSFLPQDDDRTIDVRGLNSDEAISKLETELDSASIQQEDRVKIIHGHGADILKKAVRSYLSRSVYVKKWQAGNKDSGGDGITWAEIKD
jgi:DNA mismatch repair protein MutS2